MQNLKEVLENLGYKLSDQGTYWQTNAVYRGGDNPTALQIYKDSGVWKDYVEDTVFLPIEALIEKTTGIKDKIEIESYIKDCKKLSCHHEIKKEFLKEEKSYSVACLERLLPQYDLYQKINPKISEATLKEFRAGLATSGKMYRRFVFPIMRQDGRIHGFSGRKTMSEFDGPKWLHMGKKNQWFYPYYLLPSVREAIQKENSVHIVESIGDALSLYEIGLKNVLVSFGVGLSPKFVSRVCGLGAKKIFISFNNDFDKKKNAGFHGAIKSIFKLLSVIDFESIFFAPPAQNDFGQMTNQEILLYKSFCDSLSHEESCKLIIDTAEDMLKQKSNHALALNLAKFKKQYKFHYE